MLVANVLVTMRCLCESHCTKNIIIEQGIFNVLPIAVNDAVVAAQSNIKIQLEIIHFGTAVVHLNRAMKEVIMNV